MNEITLNTMKQMKFYGMQGAFKTAIETGKTDDCSLDQFVSMIINVEWDVRSNRKIERMIKNARFHYKASIENIIYDEQRNIDQLKIHRLAECEYIEKNENVLITGNTGVGKSYIATALGYQACIQGYKVMYFNTTKLFSMLKIAKADGSYLKTLSKIERLDRLIHQSHRIELEGESMRRRRKVINEEKS